MTPNPSLEFHHLGIACSEIEKAMTLYHIQGYHHAGEIFEDQSLGIRGAFLEHQLGGPRVELLEDLSQNRPIVAPWLAKGVHVYHYGYLVNNLELAITRLREKNAKTIVPPTPAIAFSLRRVSFLMLPNRFVIELIESEKITAD